MTSTISRPEPALRHTAANLPTRLRPADLLRITDQGVADVLDGHYDHLLPPTWDPVERWSARLESDDDLDLWLISWTPDRSTDLHDHAGSLGALTVLSGALREYRWTGHDLAVRILAAGDQAAFPLGWVHDVQHHRSTPPPAGLGAPDLATAHPAPGPTLSVHAYSPPLTAMSFYEVTDQRSLRRTRTELTDEPE
ncbi:cysteine dioxygenase [Gordonia sp. NB41Y]|uniref:cysteine dioxygenase n=1 Tax=Gordonia sp. NB41Y TaxID=875808 RepID=UPI0006B238D7|nr:cysteine dioxygenase [Gordonia sp. NB41Y]KOY50068.1 cysteine dioxygenase [Gordonia sp. NB41Y]WLP90026.1 cysteine dioxygenase [Gordonia sp. NB41Y]